MEHHYEKEINSPGHVELKLLHHKKSMDLGHPNWQRQVTLSLTLKSTPRLPKEQDVQRKVKTNYDRHLECHRSLASGSEGRLLSLATLITEEVLSDTLWPRVLGLSEGSESLLFFASSTSHR
jgi:hypothetical protein